MVCRSTPPPLCRMPVAGCRSIVSAQPSGKLHEGALGCFVRKLLLLAPSHFTICSYSPASFVCEILCLRTMSATYSPHEIDILLGPVFPDFDPSRTPALLLVCLSANPSPLLWPRPSPSLTLLLQRLWSPGPSPTDIRAEGRARPSRLTVDP